MYQNWGPGGGGVGKGGSGGVLEQIIESQDYSVQLTCMVFGGGRGMVLTVLAIVF